MPPAAKATPATEAVETVLRDNIRRINMRLGEKDSHRFHDLTKLTDQLFKYTCELEKVRGARKDDQQINDELESQRRRIAELEFQLGIYRDKYGDLFRKGGVDGASPNDPESSGAGYDPVPPA